MKTTIDIPADELKELIRQTRAKTKREAVVRAVMDFNRTQRLAKAAEMLGTFEEFMTQKDLQRMREDKKWEKVK